MARRSEAYKAYQKLHKRHGFSGGTRQAEVFALHAQGLSQKAIAAQLGMSTSTVNGALAAAGLTSGRSPRVMMQPEDIGLPKRWWQS